MKRKRWSFGLVCTSDGLLIAIGGYVTSERTTDTVECLDLTSPKPKWRYLTPLPKRLIKFDAVLFKGRVVVAGGMTAQVVFQTAVYSLIPPTGNEMGQWTRLADLPIRCPINVVLIPGPNSIHLFCKSNMPIFLGTLAESKCMAVTRLTDC